MKMTEAKKAALITLLLLSSGLYGLIYFDKLPYQRELVFVFQELGRIIHGTQQPSHLSWAVYDKAGAFTYRQGASAPGVTLLTSYWPRPDNNKQWNAGIRLIDQAGNTLHHWSIVPGKIFFSAIGSNSYVHGSYLFPNGDVVFNIEYSGLVKMDACGNIVWKLDYQTHHSVFKDQRGNFWVSGFKRFVMPWDKAAFEKKFPGINPPYTDETIVKVSPDGEILKTISMLESFYLDPQYRSTLDLHKNLANHQGDIFHLNDVEILEAPLASDFPQFDVGDIMVSLRSLSTVAVLDPEGQVKWLSAAQFRHQHDPDFEPGGKITVFNNSSPYNDSRIQAVWPADHNRITDIYPVGDTYAFHTITGGKHQLLSNGNRLITEARPGRVFEVSPGGEVVWEWIADRYYAFDKSRVAEVLEGTRYEQLSKADIRQWECSPL